MITDEMLELKKIAGKLNEIGKELRDSGIIGYGMSIQNCAKEINGYVEKTIEEDERMRLELYLRDREAGLTLW